MGRIFFHKKNNSSHPALHRVYNKNMKESKLKNNQLKIKSILYDYLKEGFKGSTPKVEIIKKSFLLLLKDYFNNKLRTKPDLYMLEGFAGDMLFVVNTPDEIKQVDQKLADALDTASDLTYHYSEGKKNKNLDHFNELIKNLKNYFDNS